MLILKKKSETCCIGKIWWFFYTIKKQNKIKITKEEQKKYSISDDDIRQLLIDKYNMFFPISILHEFITNMVIFFVQVILYSIII